MVGAFIKQHADKPRFSVVIVGKVALMIKIRDKGFLYGVFGVITVFKMA